MSTSDLVEDYFRLLFQAYDKDQSKGLEKEELRQLLADITGVAPAAITEDALSEHFAEIPHANPNFITFREYVNQLPIQVRGFFVVRAESLLRNVPPETKLNKHQWIDHFRQIYSCIGEQLTEDLLEVEFKECDANKDGVVTVQELKNMVKMGGGH